MRKFTDGTEREWLLSLTVGDLERCRTLADVPLGELLAPDRRKDLSELIFGWNAERLVRVLWVLCEDQAAKVNVTPEQFGRLFDRATLDAARQAAALAVTDFTQPPKTAAVLAANLRGVMEKADQEAAEEAEKKMASLLSPTSRISASTSPASAGSTLAP